MAKAETLGPVGRSITYFQESWQELKKVHAPTREETVRFSMLVVAMIALFAVFLGFTDLVIGWLVQELVA